MQSDLIVVLNCRSRSTKNTLRGSECTSRACDCKPEPLSAVSILSPVLSNISNLSSVFKFLNLCKSNLPNPRGWMD